MRFWQSRRLEKTFSAAPYATIATLLAVPSSRLEEVNIVTDPKSFWFWDPASTAEQQGGYVEVPDDIVASDAYASDPATAPGRLHLIVSERPAQVREGIWEKPLADAAAADTTTGRRFFTASEDCELYSLTIDPAGALAADNTDNATITVKRYNANGTGETTCGTYTSNVAGGALVSGTPKAITVATPIAFTAGQYAKAEITKGASGKVVPALSISGLWRATG